MEAGRSISEPFTYLPGDHAIQQALFPSQQFEYSLTGSNKPEIKPQPTQAGDGDELDYVRKTSPLTKRRRISQSTYIQQKYAWLKMKPTQNTIKTKVNERQEPISATKRLFVQSGSFHSSSISFFYSTKQPPKTYIPLFAPKLSTSSDEQEEETTINSPNIDSQTVLLPIFEPSHSDSIWIDRNERLKNYFVPFDIKYEQLQSECLLIGQGHSSIVFRGVSKLKTFPFSSNIDVFSQNKQNYSRFEEKDVAIKILKTNAPMNTFLNELRVFADLSPHSYVTRLYGFIYNPHVDLRVLLLEFCSIGSLYDVIHWKNELTSWRASTRNSSSTDLPFYASKVRDNRRKIAYQIITAVEHLHSFSFVHLDLSSRNILITENFDIKLSDFGLAERLHEGIGIRKHIVGYSFWRAPEISKLRKRQKAVRTKENKPDVVVFTFAVDIFSFGMILWELFHLGMFPWSGSLEVCERMMSGQRPDIAVDTPSSWEYLIVQCWAQSPSERPCARDARIAIEEI